MPRVSEVYQRCGWVFLGPEAMPQGEGLTEHSRLIYREEAPRLFPSMASLCGKNVTARRRRPDQACHSWKGPSLFRTAARRRPCSCSPPAPSCLRGLVGSCPRRFSSRVTSQRPPRLGTAAPPSCSGSCLWVFSRGSPPSAPTGSPFSSLRSPLLHLRLSPDGPFLRRPSPCHLTQTASDTLPAALALRTWGHSFGLIQLSGGLATLFTSVCGFPV